MLKIDINVFWCNTVEMIIYIITGLLTDSIKSEKRGCKKSL